jgi:hypothetical protein
LSFNVYCKVSQIPLQKYNQSFTKAEVVEIPLCVHELAKLAQKKNNNNNHSCDDCNPANFSGFFDSLGFVYAAKNQNCSTDDGGGDGGVKRDWWYNGRP